MRFLADMGISQDVVFSLRQQGHDAVHLREQSLQRLSDPDVLAKAARENRILLTHDLDFGRLLAILRTSEPSIITFRLSDMRPVSIIPRLEETIRRLAHPLVDGAAVTITDTSIRWRELPLR